jgi:guanylate kinase
LSEVRGSLIVLAGPSGSGKSSLAALALDRLERIAFSVSWTSRPARDGERDGRDYCFVDEPRFRQAVDRGHFLEYATVHGNLYGTSRKEVTRQLDQGRDVLLDIDVQGAEQIRRALADDDTLEAIGIFVVPPDPRELERRLRLRKTDSEETIRTRLANSLEEIARAGEFDHILINDDLESCFTEFAAIVTALRSRSRRMKGRIGTFFPGA